MPTIQLKQRAMQLSIRPAGPQDITIVAEILREAACWLEENGMAMWRQGELLPGTVAADVHSCLFFWAAWDGEPAGTIRYQLEDALFWPDVPQDDSAFVHRLAVRRRFAGREVSSALLQWAILRTHALGRRYLRLDCETSRPRLRAVYERLGFRFHSHRQVGPYFVARYEYDVLAMAPPSRQ
jgi:GNAT superfamily N-acetyltransferase